VNYRVIAVQKVSKNNLVMTPASAAMMPFDTFIDWLLLNYARGMLKHFNVFRYSIDDTFVCQ